MNSTPRSIRDREVLRETAVRLIAALGREGAIFVCRSNYWYGIQKLIENQTLLSSTPA